MIVYDQNIFGSSTKINGDLFMENDWKRFYNLFSGTRQLSNVSLRVVLIQYRAKVMQANLAEIYQFDEFRRFCRTFCESSLIFQECIAQFSVKFR